MDWTHSFCQTTVEQEMAKLINTDKVTEKFKVLPN